MSFLSPRISLKQLVIYCRRWSTALIAGIDIRTHAARDADLARGQAAKRVMGSINQAVRRGESMTEALRATGGYFPLVFREMVEVGEKSGHLGEVFRQLAEHYDQQLERRRMFYGAIAWPMFQLTLAVCVIGLLIWICGGIIKVDILGFGLVGDAGLLKYVCFIATIALAIFLLIRGIRRGMMWTLPVQRFAMRLPMLGTALQSLAIARVAWTLHVTMNAGMEVRRSVRLSMRSAGNAYYADRADAIDKKIAQGCSLDEAFRAGQCFPHDFLDFIQVGEHSGTLVETLARCSKEYQDQARRAMTTLTAIAGYAVWLVVAGIIVSLIFRLAFFYIGVLNDAAKM
jgi:type IV pilus assembly protein PilC